MSFSQVLEVAIGLILVYYILGSIVSLITRWINEMLETRGVALEKYLKRIMGERNLGDLLDLPQMKALRPIRYKNLFGVLGSVTEPKKVEKIPVATLVDAYFDLTGLTGSRDLNLLQLAELVDKLPESEGKQAFIRWINQGVTSIEDLRKRTTDYFTGLLDQAAATFKANARSFVIILSVLLTVLFGTDSIQLARTLWNNAELRALAAAKAELVVQQEGADASIEDLIEELGDLTIKIGWWQDQQPPAGSTTGAWAWFIGLKALGLGLTAAAVSQGSSFWYDLLKKVTAPAKSAVTASGVTGSESSEPRG
jgi:hypothetical protein